MTRTRDHIRTGNALALALGALTAPAASARPAALDPVLAAIRATGIASAGRRWSTASPTTTV